MRNFVKISTFLAVLAISFATAHPASASVTIKPAQVDDRAEPGSSKTIIMKVTNGDAVTKTFYPIARDITGVDDAQHPIFDKDGKSATPFSLAGWMSFSTAPITVKPGETGTVELTIATPRDATPGSHFAGFFFSDKPIEANFEGATVGMDLGSVIHMLVPGEVDARAQIRSFSTAKGIYTEPHVELSVGVENQGNTLVRPTGVIAITNMFGRTVANLNVNDAGAAIFPKTTREWSAAFDSKEVLFGKFTASVALSVDLVDGAHTLTRNVEFWVLPMNILTPVIIGFLLFVVISYVTLRLYVKREVRRAKIQGQRGGRVKAAEGASMFASIAIALLLSAIIALLLIFFYFG